MCDFLQIIKTDKHPYFAQVPCRKCWRCRKDRVNDMVGRCIAETYTSHRTLAITLTYAGDTPNAALLTYPDVQKFFKLLRDTYKVRYIVTGEYGSKKGRAHWHAILFFKGKAPDLELEKRIDWKPWPHGYVYVQEPDYGALRYALKYCLKDQEAEVQRTHLAMSKKPPLGHQFFMERAQMFVDAHLSPQDGTYSFRDAFDQNGKRRKFRLQGRMRELFVEEYHRLWAEKHGTQPPLSEWLDQQDDKAIAAENRRSGEGIDAEIEGRKRVSEIAGEYELSLDLEAEEGRLDLEHYPDYGLVLLTYPDGSIKVIHEDQDQWLEKNRADARATLKRAGMDLSKMRGEFYQLGT